MKCICGYEKGQNWVDDKLKEINPEGKDFINIEGKFLIEDSSIGKREAFLYACPKCNIVQLG
jgi:hypothetical protein